MIVEIQFMKGIKESTLPIIKLTKSRNGETGTGTFFFIKPGIFQLMKVTNEFNIQGIFLLWENKKIESKNIEIFFKEGKPFLLKAIFIFKNSKEWFEFLNFMNYYSKETGLLFTEKNNLF
jgi:photosystem II protein